MANSNMHCVKSVHCHSKQISKKQPRSQKHLTTFQLINFIK